MTSLITLLAFPLLWAVIALFITSTLMLSCAVFYDSLPNKARPMYVTGFRIAWPIAACVIFLRTLLDIHLGIL